MKKPVNAKHHASLRLNRSGEVMPKILIILAVVVAIIFGKPIGEKAVGLLSQIVAAAKSAPNVPVKPAS
jgi:hypothetical protein